MTPTVSRAVYGKEIKLCTTNLRFTHTTPCSSKARLITERSNGSTRACIGIQPSLPSLSCSDRTVQSLNIFSFTFSRQSYMPEHKCMHVVVQDPSLVVCASHECFCLLLRADIEFLIVDALEAAFDHCISLLLCLNNSLYNSMFFTLILFPLITTLRGTPFAALCTTCFSST